MKSLNYAPNIPLQTKSSGLLRNFTVTVLVSSEEPTIVSLNDANKISSKALTQVLDNGDNIDSNQLNAFTVQAGGSRGKCNEKTVAGDDIPDDRVIDIGKAHTKIKFHYETYSVEDQIEVYYENKQVFTTGCIGTNGERITEIVLDDDESSLRINVIPDCAGETGTAWYYSIECTSTDLICDNNICYCGLQKDQSTEVQKPIPNGCGARGGIFNWYIQLQGDYYKFTPACNNHDTCYGTCNNNKAVCDQALLAEASSFCSQNWKNQTDIDHCLTWANRFF